MLFLRKVFSIKRNDFFDDTSRRVTTSISELPQKETCESPVSTTTDVSYQSTDDRFDRLFRRRDKSTSLRALCSFLSCVFCVLCIICPIIAQAQSVTITEISPQKIADEEEWFEFSVTASGRVHLDSWEVSNGSSTKTFLEKRDQLLIDSGHSFLTNNDEEIIVDFGDDISTILFAWDTSPVSLPNNGGTIQILDGEGIVLDEITYPDTRKGTTDGRGYTEIWNRVAQTPDVFPVRYEVGNATFPHSKLTDNIALPTNPDHFKLLMTESSPKRATESGSDFIELQIKSTTEDEINLKYLSVKHNGTTLLTITDDFVIQKEDFIVINVNGEPFSLRSSGNIHTITTSKKTGLSSGSGTLEILLFTGTSLEQTEDVICWMDETLSQTEGTRVERFRNEQNWQGECIDIQELIANESIARTPDLPDTDTKSDFFRHFNGSPGRENIAENNPPDATIFVQGAKVIYKSSLNFTGDQSSDPDGPQDLSTYLWTVRGDSCSSDRSQWHWYANCETESVRQNPNRIYFDAVGVYPVCLTVTDLGSLSDTECVDIQVTDGGIDPFGISTGSGNGGTSMQSQLKSWVKKEFGKANNPEVSKQDEDIRPFAQKYDVRDDFFEDFLDALPNEKLQEIIQNPPPLPQYLRDDFVEPEKPLFWRERFDPALQAKMKKNIGMLFDPKFVYGQ